MDVHLVRSEAGKGVVALDLIPRAAALDRIPRAAALGAGAGATAVCQVG